MVNYFGKFRPDFSELTDPLRELTCKNVVKSWLQQHQRAFDGVEPFNANIIWYDSSPQIPKSQCSESCSPGYRKAIRSGQPFCCFDCILCSEGEIANHTDSEECLKCPYEYWPNNMQDSCIPKVIEYLALEDPLGTILATVAILYAVLTGVILLVFVKNHNTPVVRANNRVLSYLLLISLVLCFLCCLIFIGHPVKLTCVLRQTAFGLIFAVCVSCVLAKTVMVTIAFSATNPSSSLRKWVGPTLPNTIVTVCTLAQGVLCTTWIISSPPFPEVNMKSQIGKIILECNEGSVTAFWCMLGYMGLLAVVSFIMAFVSRKLPESFNEAKYITFSLIVFVSVWLCFIPAYIGTKGKYMVAVEIFAILSSSAGLLLCIFIPKCYIILLRPEINTKDFLLGKGVYDSKKVK
ncbi:vomeronasal type-2 receptor 26-like [Protopterus annectens]|uniref:vomeronasal type-2 receptor 26-like n=1 Tax=Protopterus annectens TaxID=7888 RepID=UPI001CFB666C|nr:vomeronasal type-2 receptor 26-like [Protopterus annectens]